MNRKNIVYIIGAGASKDFGLPLGCEIYDYAYNIAALNKEPFCKELTAVLNEVEKSLRLLYINLPADKRLYPPFEEVLTLIWDFKRTESWDYTANKLTSVFNTEHGATDVVSQYVRMLMLTISGSMRYYLPNEKLNAYRNFVKAIDFKKSNITFISLNYDTILDDILTECVMEGLLEDYTYGVLLADASIKLAYPNQNRRLIRDKGVLLVKPHGSLNLVYCADHKQATYGEGYFCTTDNNSLIGGDGIRCPSCGRGTKPLIIPPLYNKRAFLEDSKPKTSRAWRSTPDNYRLYVDRRINEALAEADEIVIIGYSMPAYDYDFKSLLITSLMRNPNRQQVHIKIITKGDTEEQFKTLTTQYRYLVGTVTIIERNGFHAYLKKPHLESLGAFTLRVR